MKKHSITPRYVKAVPSSLEEGFLYISSYGSAIHSCCCGCGSEVVTPLGPAQWHLTREGGTVTLRPSVGSWNLPCQSHYLITCNRVEWASKFSLEQIAANQRSDNAATTQQSTRNMTRLRLDFGRSSGTKSKMLSVLNQ